MVNTFRSGAPVGWGGAWDGPRRCSAAAGGVAASRSASLILAEAHDHSRPGCSPTLVPVNITAVFAVSAAVFWGNFTRNRPSPMYPPEILSGLASLSAIAAVTDGHSMSAGSPRSVLLTSLDRS